MWNLKNNITKIGGIPYSRYIASWYREGGEFFASDRDGFIEWVKSTGATEDEAYEMWEMATMGKLELETSAARYLGERGFKKQKTLRMLRRGVITMFDN